MILGQKCHNVIIHNPYQHRLHKSLIVHNCIIKKRNRKKNKAKKVHVYNNTYSSTLLSPVKALRNFFLKYEPSPVMY